MDPSRAGGLSLWLMPHAEVRRQLAAWIDRLAERYRTGRFEPHLTLLGGLATGEAEAARTAEQVAAGLAPFTVRLDGIEGRDEHFRCLYARAELDGRLRAAHEAVARAFAREPEPGFLPHLSLVYGRLLPEQKQAVAHEAGADVSLRFEAAALHLWSTEGSPVDWRELGVFSFPRAERRSPR
jgi:2'-5' RNA ligase